MKKIRYPSLEADSRFQIRLMKSEEECIEPAAVVVRNTPQRKSEIEVALPQLNTKGSVIQIGSTTKQRQYSTSALKDSGPLLSSGSPHHLKDEYLVHQMRSRLLINRENYQQESSLPNLNTSITNQGSGNLVGYSSMKSMDLLSAYKNRGAQRNPLDRYSLDLRKSLDKKNSGHSRTRDLTYLGTVTNAVSRN